MSLFEAIRMFFILINKSNHVHGQALHSMSMRKDLQFLDQSKCRYASLYFCCAIEPDDNELITLEIIHRYVELLDKYFGSVSA